MAKLKRFIVFTLFSLFFSIFGSKVARAYTLTLKPKFDCTDGKVLAQGECVDPSMIGS